VQNVGKDRTDLPEFAPFPRPRSSDLGSRFCLAQSWLSGSGQAIRLSWLFVVLSTKSSLQLRPELSKDIRRHVYPKLHPELR